MTVGKKSGQAGGAVPLQGESEIRQQSSAADALTITLASGVTSTAGGQGLVVRRFAPEGTSGAYVEPFAVEYDGVRGRRHVVAISTAATGFSPAASQSGGMFIIGDCTAAPLTITLPAMDAGLWYEFYQGGAVAASGTLITAATAGTLVVFNDVAANSIQIGGATGVTIGGSVRVITDGTKWYSIMQPAFTSAAPATATMTLMGILT